MTSPPYNAVIVGARVAGSATALLLARSGARVLLVDREVEIGDTLSTHAMMRPAMELLSRWGLLDLLKAAGTPWIDQATFQYGTEAILVPIRAAGSVPGLMAPRRSLLDTVLLDAAARAGADVCLGTFVEDCVRDQAGRVTGVVLRSRGGQCRQVIADCVIGADGRTSQIAACVGADVTAMSPYRTATVYGYFPGITNEGYRWYFGDGATAGAIPTNDGLHCVFAACRPSHYHARYADPLTGLASILARFDPALAAQVATGSAERLRRFPGAAGHIRTRAGSGWALAGDAAFFKDPVTAHGITDALLDANALSACLLRGSDLTAYHRERHAQSLRLFEPTQRIASLDWRLDELRAYHASLNACIKEESDMNQWLKARTAEPEWSF